MERQSIQSFAARSASTHADNEIDIDARAVVEFWQHFAQVGQQRVNSKETASLDAEREKHALRVLAKLTEKVIVSAADAMPADKYGFAPTDGEFKDVRTFGQMVKHLSATNYILAATAVGEKPPADAGDELGPEALRTKAEILNYLKSSFAYLDKAIEAIGQKNMSVSPRRARP